MSAVAPLSARSVVLSLLLGAHPSGISAAGMARAADHFGIPSATIRAALTRSVAGGDVVRVDREYRLGARLLERQHRQEEALASASRPWTGEWELAVVVVGGRSGRDRATLRDELGRLRLAELREGVWTRPDNLCRPLPAYETLGMFRARPEVDPAALAERLWGLSSWGESGRALAGRLAAVADPAQRLCVAAALVRHLAADPLLPPELLPADWPGSALRITYAAYQQQLRELALGT